MKYFKSIKARDPSYTNFICAILFHRGIQAIISYKIARFFVKIKLTFIAQLIMHITTIFTGIEIHPKAKIGKNLLIDHGVGVVIGSTSEIGNNCTIYQGVTLGAVKFEQIKRHPTLLDNVIVGAGAKILGNITIGENCKIGANSVVLQDVPNNCTAVGIPAKIIHK